MPSEGTDPDDSDEERTYQEYKRAKNPRANDPEEAGPRDPAAEMYEEVGIGSGSSFVLRVKCLFNISEGIFINPPYVLVTMIPTSPRGRLVPVGLALVFRRPPHNAGTRHR
jgi:hypothetical protein